MGFFGSLTGSTQKKDLTRAYNDSSRSLDQGYGQAQRNLTSGYDTASAAYGGARSDVASGYGNALSALNKGTSQAAAQYQPYVQSGKAANTMYGNALGLNGAAAQQTFMRNYQADPFRDANNQFATNALMQQMNARGMSGSGVAAAAVAQESLRRGSQDYNTYLDRLSGMQGQGMQTANALAGLYANQGQQAAQYGYNQGSDLANIQGQKASMGYTYGQNQANLNTDLATTKAGNRINYGNALAASRSIGANNLLGLGGLALKAFGGGGFGGGGYSGSIAGGA